MPAAAERAEHAETRPSCVPGLQLCRTYLCPARLPNWAFGTSPGSRTATECSGYGAETTSQQLIWLRIDLILTEWFLPKSSCYHLLTSSSNFVPLQMKRWEVTKPFSFGKSKAFYPAAQNPAWSSTALPARSRSARFSSPHRGAVTELESALLKIPHFSQLSLKKHEVSRADVQKWYV